MTGDRGRHEAFLMPPTRNLRTPLNPSVMAAFLIVSGSGDIRNIKLFIYKCVSYTLNFTFGRREIFMFFWSRDWRHQETWSIFNVSDGKLSEHP